MIKPSQRTTQEILHRYRDYLLSKVSKVHIIGEVEERELSDVFVELSVVDQREPQQNAQFLGLMDSAMRQRLNPFTYSSGAGFRAAREAFARWSLNPFFDARGDTSSQMSWRRYREIKRRVALDDLLNRRTRAIVTGAPGCGKTTLLKYLALQAQEKEDLLAVWLELKAIDRPLFTQAEKTAAREGTLILEELWLRHLKAQLSMSSEEIKVLRDHWYQKFSANEIVVLLDGFDELQDEPTERSLNRCVTQFASALHDNTLLISTRPYAQNKLGKERLRELEIEPLTERQIKAFLNCYYPNDSATESLLKSLRERASLRELLHVPLLLGVILRLHREKRFSDDRLALYEAIITDLVHELDRSKSVIRRFRINDERLRLDFLRFLAFERLLRDSLDEDGQEANRIVFSYDLLKDEAAAFLKQERSSWNPRDLANDALATPLLRDVGVGAFAFTHLTLQEYLAARAFAAFYEHNQFEGLKILCRAYHSPTIVEMEVLPMMLGAMTDADGLYSEIQQWPESLTFANLRLCSRGLDYSPRIKPRRLSRMIRRMLRFVLWTRLDELPYRESVISSLRGRNLETMRIISAEAASLCNGEAGFSLTEASALGRIGLEKAIDVLILALNDSDADKRARAANALGGIGSERFIIPLFSALEDREAIVRISAISALGEIGSEEVVDTLVSALRYGDSYMRSTSALALAKSKSKQAVDELIAALNDWDWHVRSDAASALGRIESTKAVDPLIYALNDESSAVRASAALALGWVGSETIVDVLISALDDKASNVRTNACRALGKIGSDRAFHALTVALKDEGSNVRTSATRSLAEIGSPRALEALVSSMNWSAHYLRPSAAELFKMIGLEGVIHVLVSALNDSDSDVRSGAAELLGEMSSNERLDTLLSVLIDSDDGDARSSAAHVLGQLGSDKVVDDLIFALKDRDWRVCWEASRALAEMRRESLTEGLAQTLNQRDPFSRRKGAVVIGYYSTEKRTLDQLEQLAQTDLRSDVRAAAKDAALKFRRKLEILGDLMSDATAESIGDNESRELFLIGEAIKVVAEAGHIFRPTANSDWGIDGEIEFKNEAGEASGRRVYLQLKSGDSYLRKRKRDGKEIFTIKKRHAEYWQSHAYPVLLVIRDSSGRIRWMNVTEYLRRHGSSIRQIDFQGESFTADSVRQMRDRFAG